MEAWQGALEEPWQLAWLLLAYRGYRLEKGLRSKRQTACRGISTSSQAAAAALLLMSNCNCRDDATHGLKQHYTHRCVCARAWDAAECIRRHTHKRVRLCIHDHGLGHDSPSARLQVKYLLPFPLQGYKVTMACDLRHVKASAR
eukprot:1141123-Pelagomonas_calceolata.AAC.3